MNTKNTDGLDWYLTRSNNGRGPLTAEAKRLISHGFISRRWTSHYCWILEITPKGGKALQCNHE